MPETVRYTRGKVHAFQRLVIGIHFSSGIGDPLRIADREIGFRIKIVGLQVDRYVPTDSIPETYAEIGGKSDLGGGILDGGRIGDAPVLYVYIDLRGLGVVSR